MGPSHTAATETDGEVMAAIDEEPAGQRFLVADVSRDDAWVAIALSDAAALDSWR